MSLGNAGNDASGAHEDSLGEPRSVGRSVAGACQESLGDHQNAATAEALRPARAAAGRAHSSGRAARICGCCSNCTLASYLWGSRKPKKPIPDLGPLQLVDLGWQAKANGCGGSGPKADAIGYVGHRGLGEPGDRSHISVPNSGPFSVPEFGTTKNASMITFLM